MGLDTVELVMEVEEVFGIDIPDADAGTVLTVGDLYACVLRRVSGRRSDVCLSAHVFYRLRRAFGELADVGTMRIRPSTPVASIMPRNRRRRQWPVVTRSSGLRLPPLQRSTLIKCVIALVALGVFVAGFAWFGMAWLSACSCVAVPVAIGLVGKSLTAPLALHLPHGCTTVGGLAHLTLSANRAELICERGLPRDADVWHVLTGIVGEQLGVAPAQLTPATRFVEDLHV